MSVNSGFNVVHLASSWLQRGTHTNYNYRITNSIKVLGNKILVVGCKGSSEFVKTYQIVYLSSMNVRTCK